jgi:hypothetical protein
VTQVISVQQVAPASSSGYLCRRLLGGSPERLISCPRRDAGMNHDDRDYDTLATKTGLRFSIVWLARRGSLF